MGNRIKVNEINKHIFYQVPKELLKNSYYKDMSCEAILMYAVLKDRMELSKVNNWINESGEIYFIFTREELMKLMRKSKPTIIKAIKQLIEFELIEEERQGHMKPNRMFICDLVVETATEVSSHETLDKSMTSRIFTSCSKKSLPHEVKNLYLNEVNNIYPNNTDFSKTDFNKTDLNNNYSDSQKVEFKSKKKSVVAISPDTEILIENFKTIYKANLNPKHTQRLVNTKGIEVVKEYMSEFHDYIEGKNISDLGAYFYKCVMEEYTKPVSKKVTPTVPQYADFDQRHYEAEEFDKFYANMDD